jgi:hypothetical protein
MATHHITKTKKAPKPKGLEDKLESLRYCIVGQHDEDALMHLFDLISALRLRAAVSKHIAPENLTPSGLQCLDYLTHA